MKFRHRLRLALVSLFLCMMGLPALASGYNMTVTGTARYTAGKNTSFGQAYLSYGILSGGYYSCPSSGPFSSAVISATTAWTIDTGFATNQASGNITTFTQFCDIVTSATGTLQAKIQQSSTLTIDSGVVVTDGARHSVSVISTGGSTPHYIVIVDNVVTNNVTSGAFVPGSTGHGNVGYQTRCVIDYLRVTSAALYSVTTSTAVSSTVTNTPSTPYTNNTANLVALYKFQGNGNDSSGAVDPPTIGTISVTTDGSTDTITYPAPTAGTNAISTVQLYAGTYTAGETAVSGQSTTSTGSGTFTRATASGVPTFYTVVVTDSASNTVTSNEVSVGTVNSNAHYWAAGWTITGSPSWVSSATGFGRAISLGGSCYWTMPGTDNPVSGKWLPGGAGWTIEYRVKLNPSSAFGVFSVPGCVSVGFAASGYPTLTAYGYLSGNTTGQKTITSSSALTNDGLYHHVVYEYVPASNAFAPGTIYIIVDGYVTASASWVYAPTYSATSQAFAYGFSGSIGTFDEVAVSTTNVYAVSGSPAFTPPTSPLGNRSNQTYYANFDGSSQIDNNGLLQFPGAPSISVSQPGAGTNDAITFSAATAGTNSISTYVLYRGPATGTEQQATTSTASILAGSAVNVPVASSYGYSVGDNVLFGTGGSQETCVISAIPDSTHITFTTVANNHGSSSALIKTYLSLSPTYSSPTYTFTTPTAAFGYAYFYTVKTQDSAGYLSLASNEGYNTNQGLTIYADNATLFYSDGNWKANANSGGSNNNSTAFTNFAGAYIKTYFTGTRCAALFDALSSSTARMRWRIDGGTPQQGVAYGTLNLTPTLLTNQKHFLELFVQALPSYNWYTTTGQAGIAGHVTFSGLVLDAGETVSAYTPKKYRFVVDGDSITMGWNCLTYSTYPWDLTLPNDATMSWAFLLGDLMNAEICLRGYAQWGMTVQPFGNYAPSYSMEATTLSSGVTAGTGVTLPIVSTTYATGGLLAGDTIVIDTGTNKETTTVTSVTDSTHIVATLAKNHSSGVYITDTSQQPWNYLYQGQSRVFAKTPDLWLIAMGENDQLHGTSASVNNSTTIANMTTMYNSLHSTYPTTKIVQLQYWDYPAYVTGSTADYAWSAISSAITAAGGSLTATPSGGISTLLQGNAFNFLSGGLVPDFATTVNGTWSNSTGTPVETSTSGTTYIAVHPFPGDHINLANYASSVLNSLFGTSTAVSGRGRVLH